MIFMVRLQALRSLRLTLLGRSVVLILCELLANATCWIVAGILFGRNEDTQPILGLALLAWVCIAPFHVRGRTRQMLFSFMRRLD